MTNKEIIFSESMRLMNAGELPGSGRFITVVSDDGQPKEIELPMPIHTYQGWKARGYKVNRGEKSHIRISIWKHVSRQVQDEDGQTEERSKMFMTNACFFAENQVSLLQEAQ